MPRRFPLQPLLDLANDRVDAATQRLALLKQRWQLQEDKLKQLFAYQAEYRQRLADTLQQGVDMASVHEFRAFLQKLELAIRQQGLEVQKAKFTWEECQQAWLEERRKLKTFDILRERHERGETHRENRLEQRDQDEYARNGFSRKRGDEGE
mgnify:CR=1 FL=1